MLVSGDNVAFGGNGAHHPDLDPSTPMPFAAIAGVPHLLVPDNAKTAVIKACLYDPPLNWTYADMAAH